MTNNLLFVDSMTVYSWNYHEAKSTGYKTGAKVIMHSNPICIDPFTGKHVVVNGKPVTNKAIQVSAPYYVADAEAVGLVALAAEKGDLITDNENCKGYVLEGDNIPTQYKYAFTEHGLRIVSERYEFSDNMFKVRKDKTGRTYPIRVNGRPIFSDHITIIYWEGELVDTFRSLSREYILAQELKSWQVKPADDDDSKEDEESSEVVNA